jgi:hypothetical protein
LAELAEKETTMELSMNHNTMDVFSTRTLAGILRDCDNISKLEVQLDSGEAAIILFDSLRENTVLEDLWVTLSEIIGETIGISTGRMLECNKTITRLRIVSQLGPRSLGNECLVFIARGLEANTALIDLSLVIGACGLAGYEALSRAITGNRVIKSLRVRCRSVITREMAILISAALAQNRTLERFSVRGDGFEEGAADIYVGGLLSSHTIIEEYEQQGLETDFSLQQQQLLQYFFALNRFGRTNLLDPNAIPFEVWPWVLAKANGPKYGLNVLCGSQPP